MAAATWIAAGSPSEYGARPLSAKSVGKWINTVDFDDEYEPARKVTERETAQVIDHNVEDMAAAIVRLGREHRGCAAFMV